MYFRDGFAATTVWCCCTEIERADQTLFLSLSDVPEMFMHEAELLSNQNNKETCPYNNDNNNNSNNNNNNNTRIERHNSRFFTISSLRREPSPTHTL